MLELNLANVEELIFYDTEIQKVLPAHYFSLFEQWRIAKRIPTLRPLGKNALIDFLNNVTDEEIKALEAYMGQQIFVAKLHYSLAHNFKVPLDSNICDELCKIPEFHYFSTWRDDQFLYIVFWR